MVTLGGYIIITAYTQVMYHAGQTGSGRIQIDGMKVNLRNISVIFFWVCILLVVMLLFAVGGSVVGIMEVQSLNITFSFAETI